MVNSPMRMFLGLSKRTPSLPSKPIAIMLSAKSIPAEKITGALNHVSPLSFAGPHRESGHNYTHEDDHAARSDISRQVERAIMTEDSRSVSANFSKLCRFSFLSSLVSFLHKIETHTTPSHQTRESPIHPLCLESIPRINRHGDPKCDHSHQGKSQGGLIAVDDDPYFVGTRIGLDGTVVLKV